MKPRKTLEQILGGSRNIRFEDLRRLVEGFGFKLARINGSHHIFAHSGVSELVNIQNRARRSQALPDSTIPEAGGTLQPATGRLSMKDYHINIFYSDEDGGYIADIPDLPMCSAFGSTPAAALREAQKAKRAWLGAAKDLGKPLPEPRYKPVWYQLAGA